MNDDTFDNKTSEEEKVGYGKPPKHTQFKKGVSGNPKGRPKGSKNKLSDPLERTLENILTAELNREIPVVENGKRIKISMAQAGFRALTVKAGKGNVSAIKLLATLGFKLEEKRYEEEVERVETLYEYKHVAENAIKRAEERGEDPPDFSINPDHIKIDVLRCTADIVEPPSAEIIESCEWLNEQRENQRREIQELEGELKKASDQKSIDRIKKDIKFSRSIVRKISEVISD